LTGGHLVHVAVAGCLFNDILQVAAERGVTVNQLEVSADGDFDGEPVERPGLPEHLRHRIGRPAAVAPVLLLQGGPVLVSHVNVAVDAGYRGLHADAILGALPQVALVSGWSSTTPDPLDSSKPNKRSRVATTVRTCRGTG
jgi:hypothetical protein